MNVLDRTWPDDGLMERNYIDALQVDTPDACWNWTGRKTDEGYGRISVHSRNVAVHRFVYDLIYGPIPQGHSLHHLCENRACCNPRHLKPVTWAGHQEEHEYAAISRAAEIRRSLTHCRNGHLYTPETTVYAKDGTRRCLTCRAQR